MTRAPRAWVARGCTIVQFGRFDCALDHTVGPNVTLARLGRHRSGFRCVLDHTLGPKLYWDPRKPQCTLTVSSSWLQPLAMAAWRLSVSMIGVPSAACRA